MQGVGPGTVLGGRYTLRHRLWQGRDLERWSGHDATLEREVALTIVGSEHPNRAGVLDAARRAAGVEDTRLVRILDVGTQSDSSYIVEEAMSGSESLATILLQGPLPAEEARRIAGETAKGLETAGQRGLHHLRLTPHHIIIAPDGVIRVSGVAIAAAIDGPDEQGSDAAAASRQDALGLAAIVYAALTSRWPLEEGVSGVEPAPRMINGVVAPSEIAAGVPGDLDALCLMMLNVSAGPLTPGDFANRIAPWSHQRVPRDEVEATVMLPLPDSGGAMDGAPAGSVPASSIPEGEALQRNAPAGSISERAIPDSDLPDGGIPDSGIPDGEAGIEPTVAVSTHDVTVSGAKAASGMGTRTDSRGGSEGLGLPAGISTQPDDDGPPLPMLPAFTAPPPSRGQSKLVMLIVATFVGLSLFVGYCGVRGPGNDSAQSKPTPRSTVTVSAPPVTAPASPDATSGATGAGPIAILSATGFDPEGDQSEKNSQAARVYDGDLATKWTSEGYGTAQFGNLKKGVGVILDLGQPTSIHQVTIDLGSGPVDVTVYAATESVLDGASVVGTASAASGRIQLQAASTLPKAQYIIVWFTSAAPDGGQFRASIAEIALN